MKKIILLFLGLCLYITGQAQIYKTINVINPGTLNILLTDEEKATITNLTLTGTIDARDFGSFSNTNTPMLTVLDMSTVTIQGFNGSVGTATEISSYPANELPAFSFSDGSKSKTTIKSITLPNTITSIGLNAFVNCSSLTDISFPSSLISIGIKTFCGCTGLTNITLGDLIDSIGNYSFQNCTSLTAVNFGNSITSIGGWAFDGCNGLSGISLPNSVTSIGVAAFQSCSGLTNISFSNSLISIDEYAFNNCNALVNITIPNSVTSIGNEAFSSCKGLKTFTIGNSLTSIGAHAVNCEEFIVQSDNPALSSIDGVLFNKDQTVLVKFPQKKQGEYIIPNAVKSINSYAFLFCNGLTKVTIPDTFTSIGDESFKGLTGLTSISISNTVTSIGNYAFDGCKSLTNLIIPGSVTLIGESAFAGCRGLTSLTIPCSVKSIGNLSFMSCTGLTSIYVNSVNPADITCPAFIFAYLIKDNCTLHVPKGSLAAYQAAVPWSDFKNVIEIITDLQAIGQSNIKIITEKGKLIINNVEPGSKVQIYTVSGIKIKEQRMESNQTSILLTSGIYVLRVDNYSDKIIIK